MNATNNKTLTYIVGDETKPKIDNIKKDSYNSYFAFEVYEKAFKLIDVIVKDISAPLTNQKQNKDLDIDPHRAKNNIVAFIGGRGTGKTSSMLSVYNLLLNKNEDDAPGSIKVHSYFNKKITGLKVIDPTYFEANSNILEIIIAQMFANFKRRATHPNNYDDYDRLEDRNKVVKAFQKVKESLESIGNGSKREINDSIESLSILAGGIGLKGAMTQLISLYLNYMKSDILAIAIDDIDLQTQHAYKMVEQIRRYFIIPNVVILMGMKMELLTDIVKQSIQAEYKDLISVNKMTDTLENMAGRYLSKLIPYNHRIILSEMDDRYSTKLQIIEKEGGNPVVEFGSINEGILRLIFSKARYMFYDSDIKSSLIVPRNLRDILSLVAMLYDMEGPGDCSTIDASNLSNEEKERHDRILDQNRTIFRNYFIQTWCSDNLPANMYMFIRDLWGIEPLAVNKEIINFISNLLKDEKDKTGHSTYIESSIDYPANKEYNVSFSDMYYMLDRVSSRNIQHIKLFIFAIKTIYSMMLCKYEKIYETEDDIKHSANILLSRIDPDTKTDNGESKAFRKSNKLMIYSNYEKLIGGNFIRIGSLFRKLNEGETNKVVNIDYKTIKLIKTQKINDLISDWTKGENRKKTDEIFSLLYVTEHIDDYKSTEDLYKILPNIKTKYETLLNCMNAVVNALTDEDKKDKKDNLKLQTEKEISNFIYSAKTTFNILEYVLLHTYMQNENNYYRSSTNCYYDNIDIFSKIESDKFLFSSTSIIYNAIKFKHYHKMHSHLCVNRHDSYAKSLFCFFFKLVDIMKSGSLIWSIINEQRESKFDIELRNVEIIDSFIDYLNIPKRRYENDIASFYQDNLLVLKKIKNFEYDMYNKSFTNNKNTVKKFMAFEKVYEWLVAQRPDSTNLTDLYTSIFS